MEPIATYFKGYFCRSRLEARWLVFFDAMGVRFDYEPQGFRLSDGTLYLPDVRLDGADGDVWVEVKPEGLVPDGKFAAFEAELEPPARAFMVIGDPLAYWFGTEGFEHPGPPGLYAACLAARRARFEHEAVPA